MSKPSIIFVPGSYNLISEYIPIIDAVAVVGYEVIPISLPTIGPRSRQGRDSPAPSMYEDAAAIATEIEKLADQGKDVILVGHSYAGIPISQSTKGLDKSARKADGKRGGVAHLAYIASLLPGLGGSAASLLSRFPDTDRPAVSVNVSGSKIDHISCSTDSRMQSNGWMLMEDPVGTAAMLCQDLSRAEGEDAVRRFAKHSAQSFGDELTHIGYKDVPASYLLTMHDKAGPPAFQRDMIANVEEVIGREVRVTEIDSGHMVNLSKSTEVVSWILKIAKDVEEQP